jgi:hypothetical protein
VKHDVRHSRPTKAIRPAYGHTELSYFGYFPNIPTEFRWIVVNRTNHFSEVGGDGLGFIVPSSGEFHHLHTLQLST